MISRALRGNLVLAVGLSLSLALAGKAWSQSCCDESSTECRTGQNAGDKGSCTGSEVCVQFASECPQKKKHPGVLCNCGTASSSLDVSTTDLSFNRTGQTKSFTVSNPGGNVPLNLTDISDSGETNAFSVAAPSKCKPAAHAPTKAPVAAEADDGSSFSVRQASAKIRAGGCLKFKVKLKAHKRGTYTDEVSINSDATELPMDGSVLLFGSP
jgi:hypothetical protein